MKCYTQKVVGILIALFLVQMIEILMLSIVCDYIGFLRSMPVHTLMQDNVKVSNLHVDTIHAEEIEIFPLMDLDGNYVE